MKSACRAAGAVGPRAIPLVVPEVEEVEPLEVEVVPLVEVVVEVVVVPLEELDVDALGGGPPAQAATRTAASGMARRADI